MSNDTTTNRRNRDDSNPHPQDNVRCARSGRQKPIGRDRWKPERHRGRRSHQQRRSRLQSHGLPQGARTRAGGDRRLRSIDGCRPQAPSRPRVGHLERGQHHRMTLACATQPVLVSAGGSHTRLITPRDECGLLSFLKHFLYFFLIYTTVYYLVF